MPAGNVAGGGALGAVLLYGASMFDKNQVNVSTLPVVEMQGILSETSCDFFNFSKRYGSEFCNVFAASRVTSTTMREALTRALACMSTHEVECVIGPEVGLGLPSVFLADAVHGAKVVVGPRFVTSDEPTLVRVLNPLDATAPTTVELNSTVSVEFVDESRHVQTATFNGSDALCLSLMRISFVETCFV
jgi:hypothetical protein